MSISMSISKIGKIAVVSSFLVMLTTLGYGQLPSGNVFIGYSYLNADLSSNSGSRASLNGWNGSAGTDRSKAKCFRLLGWSAISADITARPDPVLQTAFALCP